MTAIHSENAEFQLLEALRHNRRKREQRGEFLVEGVAAINRCVSTGWPVRAILSVLDADRSRWAEETITALPHAEHRPVRADLFARLTDREEPPELLLVATIPPPDLAAVPRPDDGVIVVVDRPASPGNLGTIIRTADALGATAVLTTGHGAHLYDPRTIRASVGSLFALPVVPLDSNQQLVDWLAAWRTTAEVTVYATDEDGRVELRPGLQLTRPAVLLLGTERTGLARALRDLADVTLAIPMAGSASSLNVAVAHGIALHALMSTAGHPST
ncbi:MAG: TrmH family RNA methyltransferase [Acidimicrobiales bacterium]